MHILLSLAALAAPPGYNVTKMVDGCELSLGPADADGVVPMRAECAWPGLTLDAFKKKFGAWDGHDEMFSTVVASVIERTDGNRALVYQKHHTWGISDREVKLWMEHKVVEGFDRYAWTTASSEALTPEKGNVRVGKSEGYWEALQIGPILRVNHQLAYDPSGSVPGWLVRSFQTSGLATTVEEAHAALK